MAHVTNGALCRPIELFLQVAIVGRTGAGKSSLVLAILRMLRASGGRILIDGVDISEVSLRRLRRSVTVIPQVIKSNNVSNQNFDILASASGCCPKRPRNIAFR
ncbi:hypothetical protein HPB48_006184 [Haemaphysalis longicornis]|uniref:ABC transporter domain-containing protein n=1 Tax=Haemaphysalis longicornis TaxID=44386 RepID=A0A9J6FAC6_HAELO|nr:hypothetical protein HPB48_006184 [Haemaphysalis longicornis]